MIDGTFHDSKLVSETKMMSALNNSRCRPHHRAMLPEPISSSPSIINFTLHASVPVYNYGFQRLDMHIKLSLVVVGAARGIRPSRTTGSKRIGLPPVGRIDRHHVV